MKPSDIVRVRLNDRSYSVVIGKNALSQLPKQLSVLKRQHQLGNRAFLVFDSNLNKFASEVKSIFAKAGWEITALPVPAGESLKTFASLEPIYTKMLQAGMDRRSLMIALGGGSVGDAVGFVASTYMRGIAWIGLPTTLLSQVDSCLGGKTAVNLPSAKNAVGTFHQPILVINELNFLRGLQSREMISGLGEVLKYGLTFDPKFFAFTVRNWSKALQCDFAVLKKLVSTSLRLKALAVSDDEFDRLGQREVLNFGHTFAHALESVTRFNKFQHGEAVIWGLRFAVALSYQRGLLPAPQFQQITSFLQSIDLPKLPPTKFSSYLPHMRKDKKSSNNVIRFVLLSGLGKSVVRQPVETKELQAAFAQIGGRV